MEEFNCKICGEHSLIKFISFGKMPVANAFLKKEQLSDPDFKEFMYDMDVGFCKNCNMVQLINIVPYDKYIIPDLTGKTNYAFFSSTSKFMEEHFAEVAREIKEKFLNKGDKVMDIGGNDGIMLKAFNQVENQVLNIEPSHNVADVAIGLGIPTIKDFFTKELAQKIFSEHGKFKAIFSANVFLNIIDIHSCVEGINLLLDDKGIFITQDPYILDILEKNSYDQIYDEHIWYFSILSLSNLFKMHGLEVFDCERQWVHGGSMKVYVCKKSEHKKTQRLFDQLNLEEEKGITNIDSYFKFASKVEENRNKFISLLKELKAKEKKIVGYAAASKGTIVQNYCNLDSDIMEYISDSTPFKQWLYSPGKHIPIVSPEYFHKDNADYAVLGAWNHTKEIIGKERDFIERGGRFIVHLPEPKIVEPEDVLNETLISSKSIEVKQLKVFDLGTEGKLFETLRTDDKIYDGKFGQNLISFVNPGIIKGFHFHNHQTEYTVCISGNIKYVAVKENPNSTPDIKIIETGEDSPLLIKTPPGIWHGYKSLNNKPAIILYTMDRPYDPKNTDTLDKDPYSFGNVW